MKGERIIMKGNRFKALLIATAAVLSLSAPAWAHVGGCSNATLKGDYGFLITGEILAPPPAPTVLEGGLALQHFDGRGNVTSSDFITLGGTPAVPNDEFRQGGVGTYSVNADCTGSITFSPTPGTQISAKIIVVSQGEEILQVVSSLSPAPGVVVPARITARGTRVRPALPW